MNIINIDPATGQRVAWHPSRDAKMPAPKTKKPWSKARAAKFANTTVDFSGADNALLSAKQRGIIGGLASKAFKFMKVQGWDETEWRHAEAISCCRYRISEAPARMYKKLEAHFAALCGDINRSVTAEQQSTPEAQRHGRLMFLIKAQLCKLPRLLADDTENPPKGTPRQTALAWADTIATRFYGVPLRQVDVNALGALHAKIKHEVSHERQIEKLLNKERLLAKKVAKAEAKAQQGGNNVAVPLPCYRCQFGKPIVWRDEARGGQVQCPACQAQMEGADLTAVIKRWNGKERQAV